MVNSYKIISTIIVKMPGKDEGQVVSLGTGNRYVIKILKKKYPVCDKNFCFVTDICMTTSCIFLVKPLK